MLTWEDADRFWREHHASTSEGPRIPYERVRSGYRFGVEAACRHRGRKYEDVASRLEREWNESPFHAESTWQDVKHAVRRAWDHAVASTLPMM